MNPGRLEIASLMAYSEYFIQHQYVSATGSILENGSVSNALQETFRAESSTETTAFRLLN